MGNFKKNLKKVISSLVVMGMVTSMTTEAQVLTRNKKKSQIIVDYNTSIGTGSKELFGGVGVPACDEQLAWTSLKESGIKLIKIPIDLARLYPNSNGEVDTDVKEEYLHVASGQLTRARGAGMEVMLEFVNLPKWLDANNDKKFDDDIKYSNMIKEFLKDASDYNDIIKYIEIVPDSSLKSDDFVDVYFKTAKAIRRVGNNYKIGGPGYVLNDKGDCKLGKMEQLLEKYKEEDDKSLLQYISVRAYGVNCSGNNDYFGEFKEGRKSIRRWSDNADLPLYMTGWTTVSKTATTPDNNIKTSQGIKQQASALFKGMRDGWNGILFNSATSDEVSPSSYTYTVNKDKEIILNPFVKALNLLSNKLQLGKGDFKVVSTDMGSNWPVDDSIAMINSDGEPIILATNFSSQKRNLTLELKNVPYKDGKVSLECYVAKEGADVNSPYEKVNGEVLNGILNATIPVIPSDSAVGIIIKNGERKKLPAQTIYEFESQDNHFGWNTEISWKTGASFNRVVRNFGGKDNFVTLQKIAADGTGKYKALLYAASGNSNINVSVNEEKPIVVDGSSASLNNPVEFNINLKAGNDNKIKVWTESGELNADKLGLIPEDVKLSIGFQNLNTLGFEQVAEEKKYILPLERKNFVIDGRVFPENAAVSNKLEYNSSNESVVTINEQGLLTPIKTGEATITANIVGKKEITNSFKLVIKNSVASISVNPSNLTMKKDEEAVITANIKPENAENKKVIWSTSNENVIKIIESDDNEAKVKVVAENGSAIITAKTEDGGYKDNCVITVIKPQDGGNVVINYGNTIAEGSKNIFGVTHYPSINKKDNDVGDHSKAWEMLRDDMGVKFMRADARLQEILPVWTKRPNTNWASNSNIQHGQPNYVEADYYYVTGPDGVKRQFSVEGYKKDMEYYEKNGEYLNGMSDPKNWNTERLMNWVKKAKEMGFDVMVMTFQIPEWLASGYPLPGAPHTEKACNSAPKDWEIFRDIIKKVYTMVKPYADYYELLNEPHWYVPKGGEQCRPDGTPYPYTNKVNLIAADTMYQAIDAMYEAEREITGNPNAKPTMKLGGGSDDSWGGSYGILGTLFSKEYEKWHGRVEFVSIHKYGSRPANQDMSNDGANSRNVKRWLREKTGKDMPIFLNEYNQSTGQPHEYHTGAKSMVFHGRNLIDMMVDAYSGGGYYTCYPSDVPMDDYEASKGWVERGKGVYAWNNGSPTLATFTKTWNLLSKKLELGEGNFKVKSTLINNSKISDTIGAVNSNNKPVAFLNNYSSQEYGNMVIEMKNLPYKKGTQVKAKIYSMTTDSSINIRPVIKDVKVNEDGTAKVVVDSIGGYGIVGVMLEGNTIEAFDKVIEFESYINTFKGNAKVLVDGKASNGRVLSKISKGENNSVIVPINAKDNGKYKVEVSYESNIEFNLNYKVNDGKVISIKLPKTTGIEKKVIEIPVKNGSNKVKFYSDDADELRFDKLDINEFSLYEEPIPIIKKDALKEIANKNKARIEKNYTKESFEKFKKALNKAKEVLKNEKSTQKQIDEALKELEISVKELVINNKNEDNKTSGKTNTSEVKKTKNKNKNTNSKKTEDKTNKTTSKKVENKVSNERNINNAKKTNILLGSNKGNKNESTFVKVEAKTKVNKEKLKEIIEKNKEKVEEDYTKESFEKFKNALDKAEEALNNEKSTQKEIDNIVKDVEESVKQLILNNKDENKNESEEVNDSKNNEVSESKKVEEKATNKGKNPIIPIVVGIAILGSGIFIYKKKN